MEANARRQGCRGAIHRARLPAYCTLGDLHKLLPRALATGPFAPITVTVARNAVSRIGAMQPRPPPGGRAVKAEAWAWTAIRRFP